MFTWYDADCGGGDPSALVEIPLDAEDPKVQFTFQYSVQYSTVQCTVKYSKVQYNVQ